MEPGGALALAPGSAPHDTRARDSFPEEYGAHNIRTRGRGSPPEEYGAYDPRIGGRYFPHEERGAFSLRHDPGRVQRVAQEPWAGSEWDADDLAPSRDATSSPLGPRPGPSHTQGYRGSRTPLSSPPLAPPAGTWLLPCPGGGEIRVTLPPEGGPVQCQGRSSARSRKTRVLCRVRMRPLGSPSPRPSGLACTLHLPREPNVPWGVAPALWHWSQNGAPGARHVGLRSSGSSHPAPALPTALQAGTGCHFLTNTHTGTGQSDFRRREAQLSASASASAARRELPFDTSGVFRARTVGTLRHEARNSPGQAWGPPRSEPSLGIPQQRASPEIPYPRAKPGVHPVLDIPGSPPALGKPGSSPALGSPGELMRCRGVQGSLGTPGEQEWGEYPAEGSRLGRGAAHRCAHGPPSENPEHARPGAGQGRPSWEAQSPLTAPWVYPWGHLRYTHGEARGAGGTPPFFGRRAAGGTSYLSRTPMLPGIPSALSLWELYTLQAAGECAGAPRRAARQAPHKGAGPWAHLVHLVCLVYLVYLVCQGFAPRARPGVQPFREGCLERALRRAALGGGVGDWRSGGVCRPGTSCRPPLTPPFSPGTPKTMPSPFRSPLAPALSPSPVKAPAGSTEAHRSGARPEAARAHQGESLGIRWGKDWDPLPHIPFASSAQGPADLYPIVESLARSASLDEGSARGRGSGRWPLRPSEASGAGLEASVSRTRGRPKGGAPVPRGPGRLSRDSLREDLSREGAGAGGNGRSPGEASPRRASLPHDRLPRDRLSRDSLSAQRARRCPVGEPLR